jgi:hypothetical protein
MLWECYAHDIPAAYPDKKSKVLRKAKYLDPIQYIITV